MTFVSNVHYNRPKNVIEEEIKDFPEIMSALWWATFQKYLFHNSISAFLYLSVLYYEITICRVKMFYDNRLNTLSVQELDITISTKTNKIQFNENQQSTEQGRSSPTAPEGGEVAVIWAWYPRLYPTLIRRWRAHKATSCVYLFILTFNNSYLRPVVVEREACDLYRYFLIYLTYTQTWIINRYSAYLCDNLSLRRIWGCSQWRPSTVWLPVFLQGTLSTRRASYGCNNAAD